jgi:tripartite-type tricarboxylate transporter receptor subunit TctC
MIRRALCAVVGVLLALVVGTVSGQTYPDRVVRIVVPFSPGGGTDLIARLIAQKINETWGQPVTVENRAGANGNIGMDACAKSAPDGYTICFPTGVILSLNPFAYSNMPFDPQELVPVVHVGTLDQAIAASSSLPARSVRELVEYAKSKPDTVTWGSLGSGSTAHLYMEWLRAKTGASFVHVPYKGSPEVMQAMAAGDVMVATLTPTFVMPNVKAGKARVLAVVSGKKRSALMPEVPTMAEQGYELDFRNWLALYFPRATPQEFVRRWNAEVNRLLADPQIEERYFAPQAVTPAGGSPEDLAAFAKAARQAGAELAKIANLKLD